jgi:hypothetical protein
MAKKKATKKYKKGELGHLKKMLKEEVIPAYLDDMMKVFVECAERVQSGWPWFTTFHDNHRTPGYSASFYLDVSPMVQASLSGDAKLRLSVVASLSDEDYFKLLELLTKPPKEERHKHDYAFAIGKILIEATRCTTDVTCSMQGRTASRSLAHCERYEAVARFGVQLEDVYKERLYPAPVAKFIFTAWEAS